MKHVAFIKYYSAAPNPLSLNTFMLCACCRYECACVWILYLLHTQNFQEKWHALVPKGARKSKEEINTT